MLYIIENTKLKLVNLNYIIQPKFSSLNNIKLGVNNWLTYIYDVKAYKLAAVNLPYK
jgi:hypothetical protein